MASFAIGHVETDDKQADALGARQGPILPPTGSRFMPKSMAKRGDPVRPFAPDFSQAGAEWGKKGKRRAQEELARVQVLEVRQDDLTHKSHAEILHEQFNEKHAPTGEVNVEASFYNSKTGGEVSHAKPQKIHKRKHQINQLAFDAADREQELQAKHALGNARRTAAKNRYGF